MRSHIKPDYIKHRLDYDKGTGVFRWRAKPIEVIEDELWNAKKAGQIAGSLQPDDQWFIFLDGEPTPAQWLAYAYVTGRRPSDDVININGDRLDNRFANLIISEIIETPRLLARR